MRGRLGRPGRGLTALALASLVALACLVSLPGTGADRDLVALPAGASPGLSLLASADNPAATPASPPPPPGVKATAAGAATPAAEHSSSSSGGADQHPGHAASAALFFFALSLLIGVFTLQCLSFARIPYTAILLVWGVLVGLLIETVGKDAPMLASGTRSWENMDPNLILAGFLPVLLFAGAFALEWHVVRRLMASSLLLAGPGVIFGTAATAALVKYTFPHGWTWSECLLFGAMLSATDPVAVVAVLREAGLSKRLRTLVDLEALLNDGTAFVAFSVIKASVEGDKVTGGSAMGAFARLAAGGVATGLVAGVATTLWLRYMYNAPMPEITLTLAGAYMTFLVSERLLGVSGVLAVVTLGLWMAASGVNHISRRVEGPLHVVWETLEHCANTLIFILSGAIIAGKIYVNASNAAVSDIRWFDYLYAIYLWFALIVIRAAMFALFWPALKRMGYGISMREAVVLSWSGLRGAVGLALSLFVLLDPLIANQQFRVLSFFFMGAITLLTLLVQGCTMTPLLRALGLTKPPSVRRSFLKQLLRAVEARSDAHMAGVGGVDTLLGDPDWKAVGEASALDTNEVLRRYASVGVHRSAVASWENNGAGPGAGESWAALADGRRAKGLAGLWARAKARAARLLCSCTRTASAVWGSARMVASAAIIQRPSAGAPRDAWAVASAEEEAHERAVAARMNRGALLAERRGRLLAAVRQTYNDLFHDAFIDSGQIYRLRGSADTALDLVTAGPLSDWDCLAPALRVGPGAAWAASALADCRWPAVAAWAQARLLASLANAATLALALMHAHDVTARDIADVWGNGGGGGGLLASTRLGGGPAPAAINTPPGGATIHTTLDATSSLGPAGARVPGVDDLLDEMKANVTRQVLLESRDEVRRAAAFIGRTRRAWPEVLRAIKTRQLTQELLLVKEAHLQEVARTGLIADAEVAQLSGLVEKKLKALHFTPPPFEKGRPRDALRCNPILASLTDNQFKADIVPHARLVVIQEGEALCTPGRPVTDVLFIIRGSALVWDASGGGGPSARSASLAAAAAAAAVGGGAGVHAPAAPDDATPGLLRPPTFRAGRRGGGGGNAASAASAGRSMSGGHAFPGMPPPGKASTAGPGTVLFVHPVMLRVPHPTAAVAASVIQAYWVPASALAAAVDAHLAVARRAWQATAAALALAHGGPSLMGQPLDAVAAAFRAGTVQTLRAGATLRAAGDGLLVFGRIVRAAKGGGSTAAAAKVSPGPPPPAAILMPDPGSPELAAPRMLPPEPAAYVCLTKAMVVHLPTGALAAAIAAGWDGGGGGGGGGEGGEGGEGGGRGDRSGRPPLPTITSPFADQPQAPAAPADPGSGLFRKAGPSTRPSLPGSGVSSARLSGLASGRQVEEDWSVRGGGAPGRGGGGGSGGAPLPPDATAADTAAYRPRRRSVDDSDLPVAERPPRASAGRAPSPPPAPGRWASAAGLPRPTSVAHSVSLGHGGVVSGLGGGLDAADALLLSALDRDRTGPATSRFGPGGGSGGGRGWSGPGVGGGGPPASSAGADPRPDGRPPRAALPVASDATPGRQGSAPVPGGGGKGR